MIISFNDQSHRRKLITLLIFKAEKINFELPIDLFLVLFPFADARILSD